MDPTRFDHFAITIGQRATRRTSLGLLAALGLTGLVTEEAAQSSGRWQSAGCRSAPALAQNQKETNNG